MSKIQERKRALFWLMQHLLSKYIKLAAQKADGKRK